MTQRIAIYRNGERIKYFQGADKAMNKAIRELEKTFLQIGADSEGDMLELDGDLGTVYMSEYSHNADTYEIHAWRLWK